MNKTIIENKISVFWFRRDFRLKDNAGLFEALKSGKPVLGLFIFDTEILEKLPNKEDKRVAFIHHAIAQLEHELLKVGSSLLVLHGKPLPVFENLMKQYSIESVFANTDYEPRTIQRDKNIADLLASKNIPFQLIKDQVIFGKSEIMKEDGTPFKVFTPYSRVWKRKFNEGKINSFASESLLTNFLKTKPFEQPSLSEIGFANTETLAIQPTVDDNIIRNYHETRNLPGINGTSNLSVHLRFGTISIRELATRASVLNEQFLNELIWREFFMMILFQFPYVAEGCFKKKYEDIRWRNNEEEFEKWCKGETGYPIVDAGMRELNETGLMHNRVRMITASFLIKHLLIDWRWGEAYFAEKLLDYELSSNNGNWQWSAGSGCDAAPYFRVFNPYEQIRKFDPNLIYINKWVKNLNDFTYPAPIVEHKFARERFLEVFKSTLGNLI